MTKDRFFKISTIKMQYFCNKRNFVLSESLYEAQHDKNDY